ncbi:MAG: MFS transporter [Alphaproteobacteria bacterium]|nr:MFS transporter [Alphaproteobacteria bacterium]MCW5739587.1 MFS transporter [Alphaproteobacteria bacterium]
MSDMTARQERAVPHAAAIYLAVVQFFFAIGWTVYVIFLPSLLEQSGLSRGLFIWILAADQIAFMLSDLVIGVWIDRARAALRRLGPMIVALTAISCLAFLLLPQAVRLDKDVAKVALIALLLVWTLTSSALRVPPLVILGNYTAKPRLPLVLALNLSGLALAGAISPYLGVTLREMDPRLPFAFSSIVLLATTFGIIWVERALARAPDAPAADEPKAPVYGSPAAMLFFIAMAIAALGFQLHFFVNSAPGYLRFAKPGDLDMLMPVFWIGFNLAMFPAAAFAKRHGALQVMALAAMCGVVGIVGSVLATSLPMLIAAQFIAGCAWGAVFVSAFAAAASLGAPGRVGIAMAILWAVLALATLGRFVVIGGGLARVPELAPVFTWGPAAAWLLGGLALAQAARVLRGR